MSSNPDRADTNVHRVRLGRRVVKNSLAHYGATAFDVMTNLVSVGVLTRYLGIHEFGKYAFIMAFAAIFKLMAGMGIPSIVVREIARDKENAEKIYASAFLLQIFIAGATLFIMVVFINLLSAYALVKTAATLCAVAVVCESFSKLFSAIFQSYEKMEFDAYQTLFTQSLYVISTVLCVVVFGSGLTGVFIALLFTFFCECMFGFCIVNKKFLRLRLTGNCDRWRYLLKESYPVGIKRVLRMLNYRVDTLLLAAMKSSVEVGLFHSAYKIIQSLTFIAVGSTKAIAPIFSRYATTSKESLQLGYEKSFKFLILIGLPFGIFFSYFSKPVITLVLGKAFVDATPILQIFGWVLALMFLSNLMENMLIVGSKQVYTTITTIVSLCVNVILDILLISKWSCVGASFATLVSEMAMFGLMFYFVSKHVSSISIGKVAIKPIFACIATCAILFYICHVNVCLAIGCGILAYVCVLLLIRSFTREEISLFRQIISRKKSRIGLSKN